MRWIQGRLERGGWRRLLVVAALLGCVLRLVGIHGSLGLDEFGTLWAVEGSLAETWARTLAWHGQTPLYYLLIWFPVHGVGESELSLRVLSVLFAAGACWWVARLGARLGHAEIGWLAALLLWFDPQVVKLSAQARPYTLGLLCSALMLCGFLRASQGERRGRWLFVAGGVGLCYSHYYLALQAAGLALAYVVRPGLRRRYRPGQFCADVGAQLLLAAPCAPQVLDLAARRQSLTGFPFDPLLNLRAPLEVAGLFLLVALLGHVRASERMRERPDEEALLWWAALTPVGLGLLLVPLELNVLTGRYLAVMVVPAAVLAARSLLAQTPSRAVQQLGAVLIIFAWSFGHSLWLRGTFSQAGTEDVRHAVEVLRRELEGQGDVPVLYRSGFAEDDLNATGEGPATLRAPLRGPGQSAPSWNIVPLTFGWDGPGREDYFRERVGPALKGRRAFYLLSHASGGFVGDYLEAMQPWLEGFYGREVEVHMVYGGWGMLVLRYEVR